MLTLRFETEKDILAAVYTSLSVGGEVVGANFLFLDIKEIDGKLCNLSRNIPRGGHYIEPSKEDKREPSEEDKREPSEETNVKDEKFVLENVVGLWRMRIDGSIGIIDKIAFRNSVNYDDKNFFVRAMLYKLQLSQNMKIQICNEHKELSIFGFENKDGNMEIETKNIDLHSWCKG